ncbi:MAG: hypothetical protein ACOC56_04345 [Atribacterota bacterium]
MKEKMDLMEFQKKYGVEATAWVVDVNNYAVIYKIETVGQVTVREGDFHIVRIICNPQKELGIYREMYPDENKDVEVEISLPNCINE